MNAKEIKKLHQLIDERDQNMTQEFLNKKDDYLAELADTEGWKVLRQNLEDTLYELLIPVGVLETGSLEVMALVNESRKGKIEEIKRILLLVEATSAAKKRMKKEAEDRGEES